MSLVWRLAWTVLLMSIASAGQTHPGSRAFLQVPTPQSFCRMETIVTTEAQR